VNFWRDEFGDVLTDQRVLVTGASGFVGRHLCSALTDLGADVHGLARHRPTHREIPHKRWWSVDLTQADAVTGMLQEVRPQIVFHLAGLVTGRQSLDLVLPMLQANLIGAMHLMLGLAFSDCQRVVIAGSSEELGTDEGIPASPYAAAKLSATHYARMLWRLYELPVVVARLFMGYGPGQTRDKLVPYLIRSALTGKSARISSGERVCDLIYVTDIVRGLIGMACQPHLNGQIIELGTGVGITVREVSELIMELTDSTTSTILGALPNRLGQRPQVADREAARVGCNGNRVGQCETDLWRRLPGTRLT